jgi:ubiquinone/menaquinone biosynthesis C-methylase UbiE
MDSADEARDYDAMDHAAVNRAFAADFLAAWDGRNPVLDCGTGTAQIPIELCRQSATARVVGVDLARSMLELGAANVQRAGLHDRIELRVGDAKQLPFEAGHFGAVMSNSIVHHIPEPLGVLKEMVRVTARDGLLFVRDLMRPANEATLERLVAAYAGGANTHQRKMFADSLRAALTLEEVRTLVTGLGFDPMTVQATSDRHWTWNARKRV